MSATAFATDLRPGLWVNHEGRTAEVRFVSFADDAECMYAWLGDDTEATELDPQQAVRLTVPPRYRPLLDAIRAENSARRILERRAPKEHT
jgi:hypothetical protein